MQDTETYKSLVKEDMMRWQNTLRSHSSADWVIIAVETNDTKKKNKPNILPRSSIVDKIRSDFCNKQNDRSESFPISNGSVQIKKSPKTRNGSASTSHRCQSALACFVVLTF